jgi:hydroxypyruvate reductase
MEFSPARIKNDPGKFLLSLMQKGLHAVKPANLLATHLNGLGEGAFAVIGYGKAAAFMALEVEKKIGSRASGLVIVPYGYEVPCKYIKVRSAAHPIPDNNAITYTLELIDFLDKNTQPLLVLASGGGSSVLCQPADFISLEQKQQIIRQLLAKGANIGQLNQVRGCLSMVKAGGLATLAPMEQKTRVFTISDVPSNNPDLVASGPFAQAGKDGSEALKTLGDFGIVLPETIRVGLKTLHVPPSHQPNISTRLIGRGQTALEAAAGWSRSIGLPTHVLGDEWEAEAQEMAQRHAQLILEHQAEAPVLLLSGGEANVTVHENGKGGANRQFLLELLAALDDRATIAALAIDTDGRDGNDGEAGGWITSGHHEIWQQKKLDPVLALQTCNTGPFFKALGTSLHTGPTGTNVNDFRAILVL